MSEDRDYGFCPRCGALMQDGVCRSCGYTARSSAQSGAQGNSGVQQKTYAPYQEPGRAGMQQGMPCVQAQERKKNRKGLYITLGVLAGVLLVAGLVAAIVFFAKSLGNALRMTENSIEDEYNGDDYYDDGSYDDRFYDDFGDYGSEGYVPDEDDPYYKEITDCTRTDLEYGISWITDSITPDDEEDYCTYYAVYPLLDGESSVLDKVNEEILRKALEYRESYENYPGGCSSYGYVTYMDEEYISVVFQHELYEENGTLPRLTTLTFDLEDGHEIQPEQMAEVDEELVMQFRAQNEVQNGNVEFVEKSSDEELLAQLRDSEKAFFFYSPVGLEAGFNYESEEYGSGWVSVTLKDQAL